MSRHSYVLSNVDFWNRKCAKSTALLLRCADGGGKNARDFRTSWLRNLHHWVQTVRVGSASDVHNFPRGRNKLMILLRIMRACKKPRWVFLDQSEESVSLWSQLKMWKDLYRHNLCAVFSSGLQCRLSRHGALPRLQNICQGEKATKCAYLPSLRPNIHNTALSNWGALGRQRGSKANDALYRLILPYHRVTKGWTPEKELFCMQFGRRLPNFANTSP